MPAQKITLEELSDKIADPDTTGEDLAPYFRVDPDSSEAFAPVVEINPDTVMIPDTSDAATRSALLLNGANWLERMNRQSRFHKLLSKGDYTGPVIVEEGDSWFQFPVLLKDTIDYLMDEYAVFSLSAGGDTLDNMAQKAEYRRALKDTGATVLLLSGGGNDLVAGGNLASHLRTFDPALSAADYLLPSFDQLISQAMMYYDRIFADVTTRFPKVDILCHGYDYAIPTDGKWLGKPMAKRKIKDAGLQRAISTIMVDRLNTELSRLVARYPRAHYLDMRNKVGENRWHDELHPKNPGYRDVANIFSTKIKEVSKPRTRSATRGPSAVSLHIGLNTVDQGHYGGNLQDLDFCIADAEAMEALAADKRYTTTSLIDAAATREAISEAMLDAAKNLKDGDIFMLTYAGHGGQIKDFNADEAGGPDHDNLDETLCLYNGQLIDDELFKLWSEFASGVRVVSVFDCCHSGSVVRASGSRVSLAEAAAAPAHKVRAMSLGASARVFNANKDFYRSLPSSTLAADGAIITRELNYPVSASIFQLSACQSNQVASEAFGNGLFTEKLLLTMGETSDGSGYTTFMDRIAQKMPATQTPKFWAIGKDNPTFQRQLPFAV
ncbi:caspase family protein [Actibacterium lipolyticum]|uniref:Caspase domain protein n=1 Tax=Actibacterium lipolyticum TaxID=1524263 RepID=A0A238KQK7_9RHOB|nr:caspase family protein [Actibacterium lipolyticum]SMX44412.1 Caspase domain protein [Actibacterium lipolyticum]